MADLEFSTEYRPGHIPATSSHFPPVPTEPSVPHEDFTPINPPIALEFTNLDFIVYKRTMRGKLVSTNHILRDISGAFHGGTMTCILGPSGCGKTTLMQAVAGRMRPTRNTKQILSLDFSINGVLVDPISTRMLVGFVHAQETLYPTDTPFEAFEFVANLRLGRGLAPETISTKVHSVLTALRLDNCAGTYLGSLTLKGVSSGEKKRTAIGIELIPNPEILFLDEPTTGLDSVTACELVELLKDFASKQRCVVAVVHQPSSKIFQLFDNVLFMVNGSIVFHGPVNSVVSYFSDRGYMCPPEYNPADYVLFLLQTLGDAPVAELVAEHRIESMEEAKRAILENRTRPSSSGYPLQKHESAFWLVQLKCLLLREYRSTVRDKTVVLLRIILAIVFGTMIGFLFFQVGNTPQVSGNLNPSAIGLVSVLGIFSLVSAGQSLLIAFAAERSIAIREYSSGLYSLPVYSLSKDLLEYPIVFASVSIYLLLDYFLGALTGSYLLLFLGMFLTGISSAALSILCASFVEDLDIAALIGGYLLVVQTILAGFFVSLLEVPSVISWIRWIIPLRYGLAILYIAEFRNQPGSAVLFDADDVNPNRLLFYIFMLIALIVIIRVSAFFALWWRCSKSVS